MRHLLCVYHGPSGLVGPSPVDHVLGSEVRVWQPGSVLHILRCIIQGAIRKAFDGSGDAAICETFIVRRQWLWTRVGHIRSTPWSLLSPAIFEVQVRALAPEELLDSHRTRRCIEYVDKPTVLWTRRSSVQECR